MVQLELMPTMSHAPKNATTFLDNMKLPVHRWFRFSAGYSAQWVEQQIVQISQKMDKTVVIFDPFAGVGTTLLAGDMCGVESYGIEAQSFLNRVARAKLFWGLNPDDFLEFARGVYRVAQRKHGSTADYPKLIRKCFPDEALMALDALQNAWLERDDGSALSELTWLAITAILRISSPVGTAQMELIQPNKSKKNFLHPFEAFKGQINMMAEDMWLFQGRTGLEATRATLYRGDSRTCGDISDDTVDLIITSPPYVNNFDYADATRFEMSFWGIVKRWSDLHKIREDLIVSCSHHARASGIDGEAILQKDELDPIRDELVSVYEQLSEERLLHGGKKNYHLMVAGYFSDMAQVWKALRRVCARGAKLCFVIGDSAPYGIHVPVEKWLGELAMSVGFTDYKFYKTRDRNVKWRNRKHRVPLQEGQLWVDG